MVEVLAPSTEAIDCRENRLAYQEVPTLRAYLIVHQDIRRIERFFRGEDGVWQRADHVTDRLVPVPCLDAKLALTDGYRGLEGLPGAPLGV